MNLTVNFYVELTGANTWEARNDRVFVVANVGPHEIYRTPAEPVAHGNYRDQVARLKTTAECEIEARLARLLS